MPIFDYRCIICNHKTTEIIHHGEQAPAAIPCPEPGAAPGTACSGEMRKQFGSGGHYKIKGDNSASETPKRFRGEDKK